VFCFAEHHELFVPENTKVGRFAAPDFVFAETLDAQAALSKEISGGLFTLIHATVGLHGQPLFDLWAASSYNGYDTAS
jgi:hypothetical protein